MTTPKTVFGLFSTVRDAVKAKGMPYVMEYGPAPVPAAIGGTRVVFQRERGVGETLKPPRSNHRNPRMFMTRGLPILVRIHAQSTLVGARMHNHEEVADAIASQVIPEVHKAVRAFGTDWLPTFTGFVENTDVPDGWQGVTYEIKFTVDDGVFDTAWTGEAATEVSPTTIATNLNATGPAPRTDLPSASTRVS